MKFAVLADYHYKKGMYIPPVSSLETILKRAADAEVDFVIHQDNDSLLLRAWEYGNLVKVIDDGVTRHGYITSLELGDEYADGYHTGNIMIQEDSVA